MKIYTNHFRPYLPILISVFLFTFIAAVSVNGHAQDNSTNIVSDATKVQEPEFKSNRSVLQDLQDRATTTKIRNRFFDDVAPEDKTKFHINVTTVNNVVLLIGEVPDAESKNRLQSISESMEDVRQVVNEVKVAKPLSVIKIARDQYIRASTKIRLTDSEPEAADLVHVIVSDRVVYLMGVVEQRVADWAARVAANTKNVDRVIRVFEIVSNE